MSQDDRSFVLREVVIAILAGVTLAALLSAYYLLSGMPQEGSTLPEWEKVRMANVDRIVTGLFGIFAAFAGYYAGRVPSEKAAAASEKRAEAEQKYGNVRREQVRRGVTLLAEARDQIRPRGQAAGLTNEPALEARIGQYIRDVESTL
jgi:hypothetical protein